MDPREQQACLIAQQVLGATATPWDTDGRQAVVDAMLMLPDGRTAAFEVTEVAAEGAHHLDAQVKKAESIWVTLGDWAWDIAIGSPTEYDRVDKVYARVIQLCEAQGISDPRQLPEVTLLADPEIMWLVEESSVSMFGLPEVPAVRADGTRRRIWVSTNGWGGAVLDSLDGLNTALAEVFQTRNLVKHLAKVASPDAAQDGASERHLFLVLHPSALPYTLFDALITGQPLPTEPLTLPEGVTHLWLWSQFSPRVLLAGPDGWHDHVLDH